MTSNQVKGPDGERDRLQRLSELERRLSDATAADLRQRRVFELMPVACLVIDNDGVVLDANLAAASLFGIDQKFFVRKPLVARLAPSSHHDFFRHRMRVLGSDDGGATCDLTILRRDGEEIFARFSSVAMSDRGGSRSLVTTVTDQRDRLRAEQAVTAARRAAEEAVRTKGQFLANMSHELRTPLTGICGMLELLSEELADAEQRDMAETARSSAVALTTLVGDILDLTRLDAGHLPLDPHPFDPRALAEEAMATISPQANSKDLQLALLVGRSVPQRLIGDSLRVRQILVNLLGNAVKFTEQGFISLSLDSEIDSAGHHILLIVVHDSGPGIPIDQLDRIFDRFEQGDKSTTRTHGGSGLGLSIVRHLARLMGGGAVVDSEMGFGSRFSVRLRLPIEEEAPHVHEAGTRGTWIVLEDRELTRRCLVESLGDLGVQVVQTATWDEARQHAERLQIRTILAARHLLPATLEDRRVVVYGRERSPGQLPTPVLPSRLQRLVIERTSLL